MPHAPDYYLSDKHLLASIAIRSNLASSNFGKLAESLAFGFDLLPRSTHYRRILRDGYRSLGTHLLAQNDWVDAIRAFDRARQMAPRNWTLVSQLLDALQSFIDAMAAKAVRRDVGVLRGILSILGFLYHEGKYSKRVHGRLVENQIYLEKIEESVSDGVESPSSASVDKIFFNQFDDFTQEQRDELRAEILADELIKMLIEWEKFKPVETNEDEKIV